MWMRDSKGSDGERCLRIHMKVCMCVCACRDQNAVLMSVLCLYTGVCVSLSICVFVCTGHVRTSFGTFTSTSCRNNRVCMWICVSVCMWACADKMWYDYIHAHIRTYICMHTGHFKARWRRRLVCKGVACMYTSTCLRAHIYIYCSLLKAMEKGNCFQRFSIHACLYMHTHTHMHMYIGCFKGRWRRKIAAKGVRWGNFIWPDSVGCSAHTVS